MIILMRSTLRLFVIIQIDEKNMICVNDEQSLKSSLTIEVFVIL